MMIGLSLIPSNEDYSSRSSQVYNQISLDATLASNECNLKSYNFNVNDLRSFAVLVQQ